MYRRDTDTRVGNACAARPCCCREVCREKQEAVEAVWMTAEE
jgi:hypothetical protein